MQNQTDNTSTELAKGPEEYILTSSKSNHTIIQNNNRFFETYPPSQISSTASIIMSRLSNRVRFSTFFLKIAETAS